MPLGKKGLSCLRPSKHGGNIWDRQFCLPDLRKVNMCQHFWHIKCFFFQLSNCWFKLWRLCVTFRPRCEVLPVTLWVAFALYIPLGFINAACWIVDPWACRWSPSWVYSLYYTYKPYPGSAKWVVYVRYIFTQESQCPGISTFEC